MRPSVSVLMPVRDGAAWLAEAVQSLRVQTLRDFELVVVDDGSRDATPAILAGLARTDARIRVMRQEARGLVTALNRGLAEAQAPLLARLDADDRAEPARLARQVRHLESSPDIGLLGTWTYTIDTQGRRTGCRRPPTDTTRLRAVLARSNPFVHSSIMLRTALARQIGGYREAFAGAEDDDLWLRLSELTELAVLPEHLVAYREHGRAHTKLLRQAFSSRLARRAAASRRVSGADPADALSQPPDWQRLDDTFYGDIAALYRALDPRSAQIETLVRALSEHKLTPAERKLAERAMTTVMTRSGGGRPALLRALCRHPGLALATAGRAFLPFNRRV